MSQTSHEQARMLLPWYVNKTLTDTERSQVEAQLATDLVLHQDLRQLRELARLISDAQPEQISARLSLAKLHANIRSQRAREPLVQRLSAYLRRHISGLQRAMVATALMLGAGALWLSLPDEPAQFETLSEPPAAVDAPVVLRVVFRPDVSAAQVQALTVAFGGRIVEGPSANGVYTIALHGNADPQQWLARWRASPDLQFAELVSP